MTSPLTLTALPKGHGPAQAGILGHVGIGHVHSISGFVHDDSVGFAVTVSLMRDALPVDVRITDVYADPDTGWIEVHTADGGTGRARPRRGVTPAQVDILRRAVGQDAMCCQNLAIHTLGRLYGQGVHEEAACFQAAAAYSVLDTFVQRWPDHADLVEDTFEDNVDMALGLRVRRGTLDLALMAVINHTRGGGLAPTKTARVLCPTARQSPLLWHVWVYWKLLPSWWKARPMSRLYAAIYITVRSLFEPTAQQTTWSWPSFYAMPER